MMRLTLLALGVLVMGGTAGSVSAQYIPPSQRPGFSPYINLLRRDASFAQNYFGIVQPQFNTARQLQGQQQQIQANQQSITDTAAGTNTLLPATGHNFGYLTHNRYFLNNASGGSGRAGGSQSTFGLGNRPAGSGYTPPAAPSARAPITGGGLTGGYSPR